jgi:phage tail sheath protein FI
MLAEAVHGFFANDGLFCHVVGLDAAAPPLERLRAGLAAMDDLDEVDLVAVPDIWDTDLWDAGPAAALQRELLAHCRERGDRFALLDAAPAPGDVAAQATALTGVDGRHGALYHPWLWTTGLDSAPRFVPPCGHVAGIYSRGDREVGVHKAPANEVVEGVLDVATTLTSSQVGALYAEGVNCIRAFPGRGIRVWGARTLADDPAYRDIGARRVVATIGRWIERFMTGLVHEPNDVRLWVRIMRELTAYLDGLFRRGALRGRTAEEAFYVKCDSETNPPASVDAGVVMTQVGVAPSVPAEFVVVRVIHGTGGVQVSMS